jgi:hypothetical protein
MIAPRRAIPLTLERQIDVSGNRIAAIDTLHPDGPLRISDVAVTSEVTMHSPSARQDAGVGWALNAPARLDAVSALRVGKMARIAWTLPVTAGDATDGAGSWPC